MRGRVGIGYVVQIDGPEVLVNLHEAHRGHAAGHSAGISQIGQPGDLVVANAGAELIVLRIISIRFNEPREAHRQGVGTIELKGEPLRQVSTAVMGYVTRQGPGWLFTPEEWRLPGLGSEVFPMTSQEMAAVLTATGQDGPSLRLGADARDSTVPIEAHTNTLLTRHFAVLGATGEGKTSFVAAVTQQLVQHATCPRIVIFDISGEYSTAFKHLKKQHLLRTIVGEQQGKKIPNAQYLKLPYYALGRQGLIRLLLPSEKTQLPALRFAIENLIHVTSDGQRAGLAGTSEFPFSDDCGKDDIEQAAEALDKLRDQKVPLNKKWPHMRALSCLVAEWTALQPGNRGSLERNGFLYGNVSPLINRIRSLIEDVCFQRIVDVTGGKPASHSMDLDTETSALTEKIFGLGRAKVKWHVHVVDLSQVTQDLAPFVLGALLELYAAELFRRGPYNSFPTLLVLEEAHHYLRHLPGVQDNNAQQAYAYERLAKEGRKFGLSLFVSTQRPAELSTTVLSQCGTWAVFRLTNEQDQKAVNAASEWGDRYILRQIAGLPRGQAVIFGAARRVPARVQVIRANPEPLSFDSDFVRGWGIPTLK